MKYLAAGAVLSPCGTWRYALARTWSPRCPRVVWVMLNPSIADGAQDDPTIRRCVGFAQRWDFGGIDVVNLFAYRATSPDKLVGAVCAHGAEWASGIENDNAIKRATRSADEGAGLVVCAWGANAARKPLRPRTEAVLRTLREHVVQVPVVTLGRGRDGAPNHPLMLAYSTALEPL